MHIRRDLTDIRRAILVVLDGVRPDAIDRYDLAHLRRLMNQGAATVAATTVAPSMTTAALTSLLTGVSPTRHGIQSDRLFIPKCTSALSPLPTVLARHSLPSSGFLGRVPSVFRGIAARIGRTLGFANVHLGGTTASEILARAESTIRTQRRGLIFLHWPDADRAGHSDGWMSDAYGDGCQRLDAALGSLATLADVPADARTLLVALADHGGGGTTPREHESNHPLDTTIPLMMAGAGLLSNNLESVSLLDVPPTILFSLGAEIPSSYEGRVLREAFTLESDQIAVA
jgi:arylsulfatase A-like enzyme